MKMKTAYGRRLLTGAGKDQADSQHSLVAACSISNMTGSMTHKRHDGLYAAWYLQANE
jgi:hypothetical protein